MARLDAKPIHCFLYDGGHQTWHDYCEEQGVSLSGLVQSLTDELPALDDSVIKRARKIDAARRRRK